MAPGVETGMPLNASISLKAAVVSIISNVIQIIIIYAENLSAFAGNGQAVEPGKRFTTQPVG
jgi:hypothetical protein